MNKVEAIIEIVKNWKTSDVVSVWNDYANEHGWNDEYINYISDFNELFNDLNPLDIVTLVQNCEFRTDDDFFAFNSYGNIVSFNDLEDYNSFNYEYVAEHLIENGDSSYTEVDTDELLDYFIEEYFGDFDYSKIKTIIDEYMENELFDLLMEDWDYLYEEIFDYINDKKEEGNDE